MLWVTQHFVFPGVLGSWCSSRAELCVCPVGDRTRLPLNMRMGRNFPSDPCPELITRAVNSTDASVATGEPTGMCCWTAKLEFFGVGGMSCQPGFPDLPCALWLCFEQSTWSGGRHGTSHLPWEHQEFGGLLTFHMGFVLAGLEFCSGEAGCRGKTDPGCSTESWVRGCSSHSQLLLPGRN